MKKVVSFLAVAAVVVMMSSAVFAEDFGVKTASATFVSSEPANLDIELYTWKANASFIDGYTDSDKATQIVFDTEKVTLGSTEDKWVVGTVFAKLNSNLTKFAEDTIKVYVYTNNKENTTPAYQAKAKNNGSYAGLIRSGNTSTYAAGDHAPIDFLCVKISSANDNYKAALPTSFPLNGNNYSSDLGHKALLDIDDDDFGTKDEWVKLIAKSGQGDKGGIWWGSGNGEYGWWNGYSGTEDVVMFFGATFNSVVNNDSFATETIKFTTSIE